MSYPDKPLGKNSVSSVEVLFNDRKYYKTFILEYLKRNGEIETKSIDLLNLTPG